MLKDSLTKDYLVAEFVVKNRKLKDIAKELKCSQSYITQFINKYDLRPKTEDTYLNIKFGILTPVELVERKEKHITFKCICDCGNILVVRGDSLKSGNTKSCGCLAHRKGQDNFGYKGYKEISKTFWSTIELGAKNRNFEFSITIEDAWNKYIEQDRKCALTGELIYFSKCRRNNQDKTASLDRIDSYKGYTLDNIQWVHKMINRMKQHYPQDLFIEMCKKVSNFN